jgi:uncharacterized membrane protein
VCKDFLLKLIYNFFVKLRLLLLPLFILATLFLSATIASAEEKIDSFDIQIVAHKDGTMTVTENIAYDFGEDERHGIFRTIPLISKVGDLYRVIEVDFQDVKRDGESENYEVENMPKETEVKIGDADRQISGKHNYIIIYSVKNGIGSNYEDHDEIYWNVTGNDWDFPIEKASATITTDFGVQTNRVACFTRSGNFNAQFCTFPPDDFNPITTTAPMQSGEGLTIVAGFPVNTFPDSVLQTSEPVFDPDFINLLKIYIPIALILNLILAPFLLVKYFRNWRGKSFAGPSVNFDIPKNLSPAEAGIIDNAKLERNDVIATIFDLAIRKYIKIEEVKVVKTLMPDETDYQIVKLKPLEGLDKFEAQLLSRLFRDGDKVKLKDLKTDFYSTFGSLEKVAFQSLVDKKLYTKNPKDQMGFLLVTGIILSVIGNIILGPVLIFLSRKLTGRTEAGDKADAQVDGLKIFLKAMSRHHKFQSANLITVEKYIPYAIALGLQDEFMEQLKIIDPNYKPTWYSGSTHGFYHTYPGIYSSMGNNMTTSAPSSSSGFSGGSSGWGGGGGGGGSW